MNSTIYEINTRVWIKRFAQNNITPKLIEVPRDYWETLIDKGIKYVWLMGIWETIPETIEKYCFDEGLVSEYKKALPDWKPKDVIGSPYAIDNYHINKTLASKREFIQLKENLNSIGLKIILDFIPNHFNADTSLLKTNPEIFLHGNEELLLKDGQTYFRANGGAVFAHGRDPNYPAWQDTIQVNYFSDTARNFMTSSLKEITLLCDGVRCDMAMLPMNNVFENTWRIPLSMLGISKPEEEFWFTAIQQIREVKSDFIFIAEAYWDTEWQLQQLGFNLTYDKRLLDRLEFGDAEIILKHLHAEKKFQQKSIRFIENHDERRAVTVFGSEKSIAAAVVMSTIQGATLYHDGQFDGRSIKLPVQLGREPNEDINNSLVKFYDNLLNIINHKVFAKGSWNLLTPIQLDQDFTYQNILSWEWKMGSEKRVVVINYSDTTSYCRIKFNVNRKGKVVKLIDLLCDTEYEREKNEIENLGLFIHLEAFQSHIFEIG
ncbi:MAG: glycosidase [Melioribacteraceae bacterium]|nr:glycosidase [Melioribacteraceae bacterium]